jgi:hypothetical protein
MGAEAPKSFPDVKDDNEEKLKDDMSAAVKDARRVTDKGMNMEAWRDKRPWFERRATKLGLDPKPLMERAWAS